MTDIDERDLRIFVDGTKRYFQQMAGESCEVGAPYLLDGDEVVLDYTGVIGISGARKGCVYFSSSRGILVELLKRLGEEEVSEVLIADLAGEIANTISGNARYEFGKNFLISVPFVVRGKEVHLKAVTETRGFVIPISWRGFLSYLVICLE